MTDEEVVSMLRNALNEVLPERKGEFEHLSMNTVISELAIDSLKLMEAITSIEDQLGRTFEEDELAKVTTVADIGSLMREGRVLIAAKAP